MDCLGLPGSNPMMPAPPKVWLLDPLPVPEVELLPVELEPVPLLIGLLAPLMGLVELPPIPPGALGAPGAPDPDPELPESNSELLPIGEAPCTPFPPLGPVPDTVEALPASG